MDDNAKPRRSRAVAAYLGYMLYFYVSSPSSGRRLHEAETGSRLTNESCAMSPYVFVDVGLPAVDV
jgi:hypothetical protein